HTFPVMWRLFHQIHHSPQRMDMSGANLFHPLELTAFILIGTLTTTLLLGLDPVAAALTGTIAQFYAYFQHMNVRTPAWLGYVIQRPEAHCLHHQRDVHAWNYGDLPIWDLLLGTWRNPQGFEGAVGFDAPATGRLGAMLAFVDVNAPASGPNSLGRKPGADATASATEHEDVIKRGSNQDADRDDWTRSTGRIWPRARHGRDGAARPGADRHQRIACLRRPLPRLLHRQQGRAGQPILGGTKGRRGSRPAELRAMGPYGP